MSDNIGGIVSADYCFTEDIESCAVLKNGILVNLQYGKNWKSFKSAIGGIDISITESQESGISLFDVSGTIRCARPKYGNPPEMIMFRHRKILVRYRTANGDVLVAGDKENPITARHKLLNPAHASGFSGIEYSLSGNMTHPELPEL